MDELETPKELLFRSRKLLGNPYAYLNDAGTFDLPPESRRRQFAPKTLALSRSLNKGPRSKLQIKNLVQTLLREIWTDSIKQSKVVTLDPFALLDPDATIRLLGTDLVYDGGFEKSYLDGESIETHGWTNRTDNRIGISQKASILSRRFTTAHELGHLLMHSDTLMHRDRTTRGGSRNRLERQTKEREADIFATCFLIPEKLLLSEFHKRFGDDIPFVLNRDTAFGLKPGNYDQLLGNGGARLKEELARVLASTSYYAGNDFKSLSSRFSVSVETMTYRIMEIGIVT